MKKKYLFLIPIIVIIIVIILLVIPKNNYDYSDIKLYVRKDILEEKTNITLSSKEKKKLVGILKRLTLKKKKLTPKCMIRGEYIIEFGNCEITFDEDECITLFSDNNNIYLDNGIAAVKNQSIYFPKYLKKYIINLAKERVK